MVQKTNSKQHIQSNSNSYLNKISIIGAVAFAIFVYCFGTNENKTSIDTSSTYITQSGKMGSYNKESMERLVRYSTHNDLEAINRLIYNGEIFEIPQGQEAYVVESEFLGKVKIRLKGDTNEIWTFTEAIKRN